MNHSYSGVQVLSLTFFCTLMWCASACGQTNRWTNSVSGYWQQQSWLLGRLPGTNQTIFFKNPGSKIITIGTNTARNFPGTMSLDSLTIASPPNSFNELLMYYAGLQTPLSTHALFVSNNAAVVMLNSALVISGGGGELILDGELKQGEFSAVRCDTLVLRSGGSAVYDLTNGTLSAGFEDLRGIFNHMGGTNGFASLNLAGRYQLDSGLVQGPAVLPGDGLNGIHDDGLLIQTGGLIDGQVTVGIQGDGGYLLSGGMHAGPTIVAGYPNATHGIGTLLQTGGTNSGEIIVGASRWEEYQGWGSYILSNGVVAASAVNVGRYGTFTQWGGLNTNNGLNLEGGLFLEVFTGQGILPRYLTFPARYVLGGGLLTTPQILLTTGLFTQVGGTNQIGSLSVMSSYAGSTYELSGGELLAQTILLSGSLLRHIGGKISSHPVLTVANATFDEQTKEIEFGSLQLSTPVDSGIANSTLVLRSNGPSVLYFSDSHSLSWSNGATLIVENWRGSIEGGGQHQLLFGTNSYGLTREQLSQIRFRDPLALSGNFPARVLSNGEVVPHRLLIADRSGSDLVLTWPNGDFLQSSTNAAGPFEDLIQTLSPFHFSSRDPIRFFRARGP